MGAKLLAAIERLRKAPWVVLLLLLVSTVVAVAQFTGAAKSLLDVFHPHVDPRGELARLGIPFTPDAMAKAAADGDARAVGLMIDAGMPVNAGPDPALPPLMLAAQSGSVATVQRLVDAGADPAFNGAAGSPLLYAARYLHPDVVALLLKRPLPPAIIAAAFVMAAQVGDVASIRLIAPHCPDMPNTVQEAIFTLVQMTTGGPRAAPAIAALLDYKPDLNALDSGKQSLLHVAVSADALTVVNALLQGGADPNIRGRCQSPDDEPIMTPLACAVTRGTPEGLASAQALIAAHADIEARDPDGLTPLMRAAGNGDPAMTAALLKAGADPHARDPKGNTALDHARAAEFNDPQATVALLKTVSSGSEPAAQAARS